MDSQYWIAGKYITKTKKGTCWELIGVFSTEYLAQQACTEKNHFVLEVELNMNYYPEKTQSFKNLYYPVK